MIKQKIQMTLYYYHFFNLTFLLSLTIYPNISGLIVRQMGDHDLGGLI